MKAGFYPNTPRIYPDVPLPDDIKKPRQRPGLEIDEKTISG
jgi:hypothetical protein